MQRTAPALNPYLTGFSCIRCGAEYPVGDHVQGCPACGVSGEPSNVAATYRNGETLHFDASARACRRYARHLPMSSWPTLGEGGTPAIPMQTLANEIGVARVYVKCEHQNPTGSHKDRISMQAVARAAHIGAQKVILASSGNAGVSAAAYAALHHLDCEVVASRGINPVRRRAIEGCGATLTLIDDSRARWSYVQDRVRRAQAYPLTNSVLPAVGGNPFGIEGIKTIAFELSEDIPHPIDAIIAPTACGDLVAGLSYGFAEIKAAGKMDRAPALFAIEPFGRILQVLRGRDPTGRFEGTSRLTSIAGDSVTFQAVRAVDRSGGTAVTVDDDTACEDQQHLARRGLYLENASAAALSGLRKLRAGGLIRPDATVVLLATSHGFKEMP